jgi:hypothetical protein
MSEWDMLDCIPDAADAIDAIYHSYALALTVSSNAPVPMKDAMESILSTVKRLIENGGSEDG